MQTFLVAAGLVALTSIAGAQPVVPADKPAQPATVEGAKLKKKLDLASLFQLKGRTAVWGDPHIEVKLEGAIAIIRAKADDSLGQATCGGCEGCQLVIQGNSMECKGPECCSLTITTKPVSEPVSP